jgi:hypothetical protein
VTLIVKRKLWKNFISKVTKHMAKDIYVLEDTETFSQNIMCGMYIEFRFTSTFGSSDLWFSFSTDVGPHSPFLIGLQATSL